jgi:hypothetical protein
MTHTDKVMTARIKLEDLRSTQAVSQKSVRLKTDLLLVFQKRRFWLNHNDLLCGCHN